MQPPSCDPISTPQAEDTPALAFQRWEPRESGSRLAPILPPSAAYGSTLLVGGR